MSHPSLVDGIVTFPEGLPGFEEHREYMLVAAPDMAPFTVMRGVTADGPAFVAVDPRLVDRTYRTVLDRSDRERLAVGDEQPLLWLALVAAQTDGRATANLRAPVVINPGTMRGIQIIAVDSPYRTDHPLPVK